MLAIDTRIGTIVHGSAKHHWRDRLPRGLWQGQLVDFGFLVLIRGEKQRVSVVGKLRRHFLRLGVSEAIQSAAWRLNQLAVRYDPCGSLQPYANYYT